MTSPNELGVNINDRVRISKTLFMFEPGLLPNDFRDRGSPLLSKEGWLRPLRECRAASAAGADGVVEFGITQPPRPLHQRWLRVIFLDVASTPPWKGGDYFS